MSGVKQTNEAIRLSTLPWGEVLPYMGYIGMCRCEGFFSSNLLLHRVYKSERLGLEQSTIFHETDQLVEDFIWTKELLLKNIKKLNRQV